MPRLTASVILLSLSMILVSFPLSSTTFAQLGSPNPDINLDCPDSTVEIEVGPGDSRVGSVVCTLENPSIHQEEVNITVDEVGLNIAYPGTVSVSAGEEETFTITWSADPGSDVETLTSEVEVVVESFGLGIPCPQCSSKSDSVRIEIM